MRRAVDAVMPGAPASFYYAPGVGVPVGSRLAVNHGTVTGSTARKFVALDPAGETVTLGYAHDVNAIAPRKFPYGDRGTDFNAFNALPKFPDMASWLNPRLLKVSRTGPIDAFFANIAKGKRHRFVSMFLWRFAFDNGTRPSRNHGNGDVAALVRKDAGHSHFATDDVFQALFHPQDHASRRSARNSCRHAQKPRPARTTTSEVYQGVLRKSSERRSCRPTLASAPEKITMLCGSKSDVRCSN